MLRDMTLAERNAFLRWFPSINVDLQPRVTGEATRAYNCIAWTVGLTNQWINPKQSLADWDAFYAPYGYAQADAGEIAVWKTPAAYTHGCIATSEGGFNWESKCGGSLRILHQLPELVGAIYGDVFVYYKKQPSAPSGVVQVRTGTPAPHAMNEHQRAARLHDAVKGVPSGVRREFDEQFDAWSKTWFEGPLALSSDTRTRADGYSYSALLGMGPEIIPLVVEKLEDPANFMAVQLLVDLSSETTLLNAADPRALAPGEGEQARARRLVDAYLQSRG